MNIAKYLRSRAACELLEDDPAAGSEVTKEAPEGAAVSPLPHDVSIVTPAEAPPHAGRELTVEWGAATDPNRAARSSQQDAAALMRLELAHPTDGALHVIAAGLFDGAGGHAAGEEASGMAATDILPGILSRVSTVADTAQVPDLLREQIWEANRRIFAGTSRWGGAATTLALALCLDGQWLGRHLWVAHIGDSRVYAVTPEGVVTAVTTDHSQVAALVQAGEITPEEALSHPDGNLITAALGAAPVPAACDISYLPLSGPLAVVLVCDGVWGPLLRAEAQRSLAVPCFRTYLAETVWSFPPQEAARRLVADALRLGGDDNATALVLRLGGADISPTEDRRGDGGAA